MTERIRIQRELIALCKAGDFYQVTYGDDDLPADLDPTTATVVTPASVKCNEIESQFTIDQQYGLDLKLKRVNWVFELLAEWDKEVTLEFFEKDMEDPPTLPASGSMRQVTLVLLNVQPQHPVTRNAANGTNAKYTFMANLGRS